MSVHAQHRDDRVSMMYWGVHTRVWHSSGRCLSILSIQTLAIEFHCLHSLSRQLQVWRHFNFLHSQLLCVGVVLFGCDICGQSFATVCVSLKFVLKLKMQDLLNLVYRWVAYTDIDYGCSIFIGHFLHSNSYWNQFGYILYCTLISWNI